MSPEEAAGATGAAPPTPAAGTAVAVGAAAAAGEAVETKKAVDDDTPKTAKRKKLLAAMERQGINMDGAAEDSPTTEEAEQEQEVAGQEQDPSGAEAAEQQQQPEAGQDDQDRLAAEQADRERMEALASLLVGAAAGSSSGPLPSGRPEAVDSAEEQRAKSANDVPSAPGEATKHSAKAAVVDIHHQGEMGERLRSAGARVGRVTCSLMWHNTDDLDLHCATPFDEHIHWKNKKGKLCGGHLDVDMNASDRNLSSMPIENIVW